VSDINNYYLKVEFKDALWQIYLNGVPILRSEDTDALSVSEPINLWLIENENTLSFEILKPDDVDDSLKPTIKATIFLHDKISDVPLAKKIIASILFDNDEHKKYPISDSVSFNFEDEILINVWKDASSIGAISERDKQDILKLATLLPTSIVNKKYDDAIELQRYKIQEDALAEGKAYSHFEKVLKKIYGWLDSQGEITSQPMNPDEEYQQQTEQVVKLILTSVGLSM